MRRSPFHSAVLGTAMLALASCVDQPTSPSAVAGDAVGEASFARGGVKGPDRGTVSGAISAPITDAAGATVGTLTGTAYLRRIDVNDDRTLSGTVRIIGTAVVNGVSTPVDITQAAPLLVNETGQGGGSGDITTQSHTEFGGCDILNLVLGPLDLNLLGLEVHLNQVVLDIVAQTGAGNLLGNLLCAVTGLLDGVAIISSIAQILERINDILGAIPI